MRTILQVPVDKKIRQLAEKSALNMGFSSLQESLRVIMRQMSLNKINLNLIQQEPDEILTPEQEKILLKKDKASQKEIAKGNYFSSSNIDEIMKNLNSYNE